MCSSGFPSLLISASELHLSVCSSPSLKSDLKKSIFRAAHDLHRSVCYTSSFDSDLKNVFFFFLEKRSSAVALECDRLSRSCSEVSYVYLLR